MHGACSFLPKLNTEHTRSQQKYGGGGGFGTPQNINTLQKLNTKKKLCFF